MARKAATKPERDPTAVRQEGAVGSGPTGAGAAPAVEVIPLESVAPDPANARKRTKRNLDAIGSSLREFGAGRSIVLDSKRIVRAGNGTVEKAKQEGFKEVLVVKPMPGQLVAVQRDEWSPSQAKAYAIADNRAAELAEWDMGVLLNSLDGLGVEGLDVSGLGFTETELKNFAKNLGIGQTGTNEDDQIEQTELAELLRKWDVKPGDLWTIPSASVPGGLHRIGCGDSTKKEAVDAVIGGYKPLQMITDPPYGVDYDPTWRREVDPQWEYREGKVANDTQAEWTESYRNFPGDVAYVWHAGIHAGKVAANLYACGFEIRAQIIWAKQSLVMGRGAYHWQHEPCWYAVRKGKTAKWTGDRKQSTIWEIPNVHKTQGTTDDGVTGHGTQKPLECMARPMRNHGEEGTVVYDPFLGSGTTLVAAEQSKRLCVGMELFPQYVAAVLERASGQGLTPTVQRDAFKAEPPPQMVTKKPAKEKPGAKAEPAE